MSRPSRRRKNRETDLQKNLSDYLWFLFPKVCSFCKVALTTSSRQCLICIMLLDLHCSSFQSLPSSMELIEEVHLEKHDSMRLGSIPMISIHNTHALCSMYKCIAFSHSLPSQQVRLAFLSILGNLHSEKKLAKMIVFLKFHFQGLRY